VDITVSIPVEEHVKKYLDKNVFISKPYRLTTKNPYSLFIMQLLNYKGITPYEPTRCSRSMIEVYIGSNNYRQNRLCMSSHHASVFNRWVTDQIKKEFFDYVSTVLEFNPAAKIDPLIAKFVDKYELQDTQLSFQTMKRNFYRRRDELGIVPRRMLIPEVTPIIQSTRR
jgi:hypothetical protein